MDKDEILENDFLEWMVVKDYAQKENIIMKFSEGEIWWVAIGKNVGVEINGKSKAYSRPVVVLRKLSDLCFLGIPLTTQPHTGSWYVNFKYRGKEDYAVLSQVRMFSVARLYNRMGKLETKDLKKIKDGLIKIIR